VIVNVQVSLSALDSRAVRVILLVMLFKDAVHLITLVHSSRTRADQGRARCRADEDRPASEVHGKKGQASG
jgi:hypothetical protein